MIGSIIEGTATARPLPPGRPRGRCRLRRSPPTAARGTGPACRRRWHPRAASAAACSWSYDGARVGQREQRDHGDPVADQLGHPAGPAGLRSRPRTGPRISTRIVSAGRLTSCWQYARARLMSVPRRAGTPNSTSTWSASRSVRSTTSTSKATSSAHRGSSQRRPEHRPRRPPTRPSSPTGPMPRSRPATSPGPMTKADQTFGNHGLPVGHGGPGCAGWWRSSRHRAAGVVGCG